MSKKNVWRKEDPLKRDGWGVRCWILFSHLKNQGSNRDKMTKNVLVTKRGVEKFLSQPRRDLKRNSDVWSDLRNGPDPFSAHPHG